MTRHWIVAWTLALLLVHAPIHADDDTPLAVLAKVPNISAPPDRVASPDGRYVVLAKGNPDRAANEFPLYDLFLDDQEQRHSVDLIEIYRNVGVLWRNDSKMFFVNDNAGSNTADCLIYRPYETKPVASIADEASRQLRLFTETEGKDISHLYFSCTRFLQDKIEVVVYGHHDSDGREFSHVLVYRPHDARFEEVTRK